MKKTHHSATRWVVATEASQAHTGAVVALDSAKIKHLRKVLRMEWGDTVYLVDGSGRAFDATLVEHGAGGGLALGELVKQTNKPAETELVIFLPKNSTMDWIVEKAVECGVSKIVPVVSSHSVVKPHSDDMEKYIFRWQAIMDGALEQSEQLWRAVVDAPVSFEKWTASLSQESKESGESNAKPSFVFVSELRRESLETSDANALAFTWRAFEPVKTKPLRLVIGPEGGFSEEERMALSKIGCTELSLGSAVLRVETAVVFVLALLRMRRAV